MNELSYFLSPDEDDDLVTPIDEDDEELEILDDEDEDEDEDEVDELGDDDGA